MQHFQLILIVIGLIAITAVLIHGYIVSRKEKSSVADNLSDNEGLLSEKTEIDSQDGDALSEEIRIIRACRENEDESCDFSIPSQTDDVEGVNFAVDLSHQQPDCEEVAESVSLDNEPPALEEIETLVNASPSGLKIESEFVKEQVENKDADSKPQPDQEKQDHFIFNVVAREGATVRGHELLQFFLTAGFRFGEMSIFHRHLHSDGTGPVLFSIANMMKPGVFDLENMEQFRSEGVSFFLTAPNNEINIKEAFDMMVVAVEQMAEEFDCVVLNGARKPLTEEQYRNYHERLLHYI